MDTVVSLVLILMTCYCVSDAQEISNSDDTGNYSEVMRCIGQYKTLQAHVLNNEEIMDELTATFFTSGQTASKFVKITYNFQVSSSTNITDGLNCSGHQDTYIWSEISLYLLGPKPLYWFTLFAINVPELAVSIELPCLCHDVYNSLLSRLTSMV